MYSLDDHLVDHALLQIGSATVIVGSGIGSNTVLPVFTNGALGVIGDSNIAVGGTSGFLAILDTSALTSDTTIGFSPGDPLHPNVITGEGTAGELPVFSGGTWLLGTGINWDGLTLNSPGKNHYFLNPDGTQATFRIGHTTGSDYFQIHRTISDNGIVKFTVPASGGRIEVSGNTSASAAVFYVTGGIESSAWFNKVAITKPATGSTFTLLDGKTLTVDNTLELAGTDSTVMTFPSTTASIARIDAAQSFAGVQTFGGTIVNRSTTATQFTTGYDASNQMAWNTTSTGATTLTMASNNNSSSRLTLLPSGTVMATATNAAIFQVLDFSSNQRFWVGRTTGTGATRMGVRMGFDSANYMQVYGGTAINTDTVISQASTGGTAGIQIQSSLTVTALATFTGGASFTTALPTSSIGFTFNTVAPVSTIGMTFSGGGVISQTTGQPTMDTATVFQATPVSTFPGQATTGASAWPQNTAVTAITSFCTNDSGKQYRCITTGTTANTPGAGPTGTSEDITDGSAHWKYIGLVHTGAARYNFFQYCTAVQGTDANGVGGNDPEFISIRGYNVKEGAGTRQDTTEYALYEQVTWGYTESDAERWGEWGFSSVTPAGNLWSPIHANFAKLGTENPAMGINFKSDRTTTMLSMQANGVAIGGAKQFNGDLEIYGGGSIWLGGTSGGQLQFEGVTGGGTNYTIFSVIDPTSPQTINLPDASGTVLVLASPATGGSATAGVLYTGTEQAMLQAAYDVLRTMGALT